jgi:hypothetical protein
VVVVAALAGLGWTIDPGRAHAQDYASSVYTVYHNMQTFEQNGERVRAIRIPVYITLRSWEERTMGLRLRLAATFAASDLFYLLEQRLEDVRVLGFVPGMEFVFPMGKNHMLRPFLDAGAGFDNATEKLNFLGALGLRTEFIYPHGRHIFGLEPGFQLSLNTVREGKDQTSLNPFLTLSARRSLGFRIAGYIPDAGFYVEGGYNFQTFELASVTSTTGNVNSTFELGLDFGFSRGRPRIGPFRLPRVRIGYRFGDVEGWRIRFGGDWLTTVAEQQKIEAAEQRAAR